MCQLFCHKQSEKKATHVVAVERVRLKNTEQRYKRLCLDDRWSLGSSGSAARFSSLSPFLSFLWRDGRQILSFRFISTSPCLMLIWKPSYTIMLLLRKIYIQISVLTKTYELKALPQTSASYVWTHRFIIDFRIPLRRPPRPTGQDYTTRVDALLSPLSINRR